MYNSALLLCLSLAAMSGCGRDVPNLTKSGDDRVFVEHVHLAIRCELISAIHEAKRQATAIDSLGGKAANFFETWGVKYTLTLQVTENLSGSASINGTSEPAPSPGDTVATIGLGFGGSTKATRTETDQSFNTVKLYAEQARCGDEIENSIVPNNDNLGLQSWILTRLSLVQSGIIGSITEKESFTYSVKFDVARTGSLSPKWTFVQRELSSVATSLAGGRSTAHSVLVTFGPTNANRTKLSEEAAEIHNANI